VSQEGTILLQCIGTMSDDDTLPTIVKILDAHGMAMPLIRRGVNVVVIVVVVVVFESLLTIRCYVC
jgi:hypothetical protein